jgi:hypothetical protein
VGTVFVRVSVVSSGLRPWFVLFLKGDLKKIPPLHKNNAVNLGTKQSGMAQRSHKIIVVLFFMACPIFLQAQKPFQRPKTMQQVIGRMNYEQQRWTYRNTPAFVRNITFKSRSTIYSPPLMEYNCFAGPIPISNYSFHLSPKLYTQSLGFFCQKELKLDKITPVPFRFRLGSMEYVNWMEQKPNAIKPGL